VAEYQTAAVLERQSAASDEVLLSRMRLRHVAALDELYERYHRQAFALALRIVASRDVAEEVTQDAFFSIWRQAASYDIGVGRVRPWLFSIVHHRAIDRLRRVRERQPWESLDEAWMKPAATDVFRDVYQGVQHDQIRAALAQLPNEQRQAIDLSYFGGRTFVEIAQMTNVPVGTVKSRVRLALGKLRGLLDEELAS
jgi:RNA polymerase sigma-70 factor (ECF subfamily)